MTSKLACIALAALLACSKAPPGSVSSDARTKVASKDLVTSLQVNVVRDSVRFALHVTNPANRPVRLEFPTSQRYDFVVRTAAGEQVWKASEGQMFAQHVSEDSIAPGATVDFVDSWQPGAHTGEFTATALVTAGNRRIEQRADFVIPKR